MPTAGKHFRINETLLTYPWRSDRCTSLPKETILKLIACFGHGLTCLITLITEQRNDNSFRIELPTVNSLDLKNPRRVRGNRFRTYFFLSLCVLIRRDKCTHAVSPDKLSRWWTRKRKEICRDFAYCLAGGRLRPNDRPSVPSSCYYLAAGRPLVVNREDLRSFVCYQLGWWRWRHVRRFFSVGR